MTIVRLVYLCLILGTGLFAILYVDSLALVLFLAVLIIPIILFLILAFARLLTKASAELKQTAVAVGESAEISINVQNYSPVILTGVRAVINYENSFSDSTEKNELVFSINALSKQKVLCDITSAHVGVVKLKVSHLVLSDYFRLFSFKLKIKKEFEISFLPKIEPLRLEMRQNCYLNTESEVFSKTKKGDDPSEVFAIREFAPGDKLNRIHWKLSSKQETIMVKDYSLPINNNIVILFELNSTLKNGGMYALDAVLSIVASVSKYFYEAQINHSIAWKDEKSGRFFCEAVKNEEDLYAVLGLVLSSRSCDKKASLSAFADENIICSHMIYVSAVADSEVLALFDDLMPATLYTVLQAADGEIEDTAEHANNLQICSVPFENFADSVSEIVF